jgi:hypothetical protein
MIAPAARHGIVRTTCREPASNPPGRPQDRRLSWAEFYREPPNLTPDNDNGPQADRLQIYRRTSRGSLVVHYLKGPTSFVLLAVNLDIDEHASDGDAAAKCDMTSLTSSNRNNLSRLGASEDKTAALTHRYRSVPRTLVRLADSQPDNQANDATHYEC